MKKVMATTQVRQFHSPPPSILISMVFCEKGKNQRSMSHAMTRSTMTSGIIIMAQSKNPKFMLRPLGSLSTLKAKALGGVPMGVPIPPRLAPMGMAMVSAILPLPLAGRVLNTGARNVSIMAAVAVLEMNMEKMPVMMRNPNSTFSLLWPNSLSRKRASITSSPDLEAAMARMKPPKKRMIVGSAKQAITPW